MHNAFTTSAVSPAYSTNADGTMECATIEEARAASLRSARHGYTAQWGVIGGDRHEVRLKYVPSTTPCAVGSKVDGWTVVEILAPLPYCPHLAILVVER